MDFSVAVELSGGTRLKIVEAMTDLQKTAFIAETLAAALGVACGEGTMPDDDKLRRPTWEHDPNPNWEAEEDYWVG